MSNEPMSGMRALTAFLILSLVVVATARAQEAPDSVASATADSLLRLFSPASVRMLGMGKQSPITDTLSGLHSNEFERTDALSMVQVLGRAADFFVWDLGEPGQDSQLLFRGLDWRSIALSLDGLPLNDPLTEAFNLYDLPIEFVDEIEVLSGADALTSLKAAPAATVNAVSHQYISYRPTTKIRFLQGPYGEVFTDGLFTQNVARTTNLVFGFQRHATDGRYPNASYDAWNLRSRLRFDVASRFNLALTYLYTKRVNGMNGGVYIDSTRTIFEAAASTVRNPQATETVWRHDVVLSGLAAFFPDTTVLTRMRVFYTLHEREYRDYDSPIYSNPALDRTNVWGAHVEQQIPFIPLRAVVGGDIQFKDVTASPNVGIRHELTGSVWAQADVRLFSFVKPFGRAREEFIGDERLVSYSGGLTFNEGGPWELSVDASSAWRPPSLLERYWGTPLVTRLNDIVPEKHSAVEGVVRARPWGGSEISVTAFERRVADGIVFVGSSPAPARTTGVSILSVPRLEYRGVTLDVLLPIWRFGIRAAASFLEYKEADTLKTLLQKLRGVCDLYFRDQFFHNHLDLKVGARVQGMTQHRGMEFVPPMLVYIENRGEEVGKFGSLDLYGVFQIGDAVVTLTWANILNIGYYVTPVHPMLDRSITLGINWQFLD